MEVTPQEKAIAFLDDHFTALKIDTDEKCITCLKSLKTDLSLDNDQLTLIDSCISFLSSKDGETMEFGLGEVFALCQLGIEFPMKSSEIMACVDHINKSMDYEAEFTEERAVKLQNVWKMMSGNKDESEDEELISSEEEV